MWEVKVVLTVVNTCGKDNVEEELGTIAIDSMKTCNVMWCYQDAVWRRTMLEE